MSSDSQQTPKQKLLLTDLQEILLKDRIALSREKAAIALDLGLRTLDRLTADGDIPCAHVGKAVRYRVADLEEFLLSRMNKEPGSA